MRLSVVHPGPVRRPEILDLESIANATDESVTTGYVVDIEYDAIFRTAPDRDLVVGEAILTAEVMAIDHDQTAIRCRQIDELRRAGDSGLVVMGRRITVRHEGRMVLRTGRDL